ncbi:uncharacterized protein [Nicotiana tomentosiformis]|uniref:uncharacterized protein n=1 Tax=Nicotiana tomentosiformis TaxID=4098 RepID=UPI00388CC59B
MGIVEVSGVTFTIFKLSGAAYQWWQVYEEGRPANATPPTRAQFSEIFLKEFAPHTLRDAWCTEFERLRQGTMTVSEYAIRFIEGLDYDLKIFVARELQTDTPFQQVVEIARMMEGVLGEERGYKEVKRSRSSGGFSGFYSSAMTHYGGGSSTRPAHSAHHITRGASVSSYSAPPIRVSYSGYSNYPAQTQYEQALPQRDCYECGDSRNIMRNCPRLGRGGFYQNTQATGPNAITTPRAQPVRGGGKAGKGCPRGAGPSR